MTKAKFTYDNTAKQGYRLDYAGGAEGDAFYLKNCGFFDDKTAFQSVFAHPAPARVPDVDLAKLD